MSTSIKTSKGRGNDLSPGPLVKPVFVESIARRRLAGGRRRRGRRRIDHRRDRTGDRLPERILGRHRERIRSGHERNHDAVGTRLGVSRRRRGRSALLIEEGDGRARRCVAREVDGAEWRRSVGGRIGGRVEVHRDDRTDRRRSTEIFLGELQVLAVDDAVAIDVGVKIVILLSAVIPLSFLIVLISAFVTCPVPATSPGR